VLQTQACALKEQQALQEKLVTAYLRGDKAILPVFERMNRKFEEDIAALQGQIAEVDIGRATFVNIPRAWARADPDQKQRVQNILFPSGLKYTPGKDSLNSDNDCLRPVGSISWRRRKMVRPRRFELLTYSFGGCRSIQLSYGRVP
jgi:hypothetical protein